MTRRTISILGIISALSLTAYLLTSYYFYRIGFPLDDAWIHQAYARNLALNHEWAFISGIPSAGSTGPLWAGLLAVGYLLKAAPYFWTFLLGWFTLWGIGVLGAAIFSILAPRSTDKMIWAGLLLILEWHLVWAAASGMETLIFALLGLAVLGALTYIEHRKIKGQIKQWVSIGALIGISIWLRPGGITLLGPALATILFSSNIFRKKIRRLSSLLVGFSMVFFPYLLFNRIIANAWWPNTFYAKQAEYAFLQSIPLWKRFLELGVIPLVGVGITLLPGMGILLKNAVEKKRLSIIFGSIWAAGYLGLYVWRLPVTYQHGRYLIPMMPIFFVWSFAGFALYLENITSNQIRRIIKKSWALLNICVLLAFWWLGALAYARDVAVIETEMVAVAHWVEQNLEADVVIAAHDIGALGYFAERPILDLAGLISPDVISFIRDEAALDDYLDRQGAAYLITFPNWYPKLRESATLVFQTQGYISPQLGGENMAVYIWNHP
ncbi:MAG: hypothetical protein ABFS03_07345 [Chloroflexota bacterium]